jgi:hypothetical protein
MMLPQCCFDRAFPGVTGSVKSNAPTFHGTHGRTLVGVDRVLPRLPHRFAHRLTDTSRMNRL